MQKLFREEAVSWYSICNGLPTRSQPYWAVVEQLDYMVRKECPSNQSKLWGVLQVAWGEISSDCLNKLIAQMPKVCKAVTAAKGRIIWWKQSLNGNKSLFLSLSMSWLHYLFILQLTWLVKVWVFVENVYIFWVTQNLWPLMYVCDWFTSLPLTYHGFY